MKRGDDLIYGGRISADDLLGDPDLLRRDGRAYVAGDIKSGAGEEGASEDADGKPKRHYAVQLALYTDILEKLGLSAGRTAFVWDVHGKKVVYDLAAPQGPRTPASLWDLYQENLEAARTIVAKRQETLPALGGMCKLCHWRTACRRRLEALDDLTLIHELGRARRDAMLSHVSTVHALAKADLGTMMKGNKSAISGVGSGMLARFQARARLLTAANPKPYLLGRLDLPHAERELFFDVETDPMRDVCYLHGFVERQHGNNATERYSSFFATEPTVEAEQKAFAEAWAYVQASRPCMIYYYSPYERTTWRKLQEKYPQVATREELEGIFAEGNALDLYYGVVKPETEWPTHNYSIKTLASFLGFSWRDTDPSGAASIEWYHRLVESGDVTILQRILEYNEDDCRAMRVLLDCVHGLQAG
jgi:predicted RecB family nuclease